MPTYISLLNWTEQGVRNYRDTVDRYEQARQAMEKVGVQLKDAYWTIGPYDLVVVSEAADDESHAAGLLTLAAAGNVRSTTLRAFSADEMRSVIKKAG